MNRSPLRERGLSGIRFSHVRMPKSRDASFTDSVPTPPLPHFPLGLRRPRPSCRTCFVVRSLPLTTRPCPALTRITAVAAAARARGAAICCHWLAAEGMRSRSRQRGRWQQRQRHRQRRQRQKRPIRWRGVYRRFLLTLRRRWRQVGVGAMTLRSWTSRLAMRPQTALSTCSGCCGVACNGRRRPARA